ncbi:unnamed protein product [Ceutorhynchus assimilis]|uniref:Uncharacterized protein n=1 Tax=Ceutorhynchus assimilis TaxID=467358 RepID=A0A9N9MIR3_9CUCU|nr:unnamed protein product [Ceutorhynchus assimilis]
MNKLVLDVQGFTIENNKFIPKELAAYDGTKICHYIFRPPFDIQHLPPDLCKQANWLIHNHHCICWNEGYTPIYKFADIVKNLTGKVDNVYVKGKEKSEYIRKYSLKPVLEFEDKPALQKGQPECFYHLKSQCICALSNVFYLYNNFIMIE